MYLLAPFYLKLLFFLSYSVSVFFLTSIWIPHHLDIHSVLWIVVSHDIPNVFIGGTQSDQITINQSAFPGLFNGNISKGIFPTDSQVQRPPTAN